MNILQKMQDRKGIFTKSELKICNYIYDNPQIVESLPISRIAERAGSSKSAVLRFCQKLDFSGYSEFKYELIRCLHNDNLLTRTDNSSPLINYTDAFKKAISEIALLQQDTLLQITNWIQAASVIRVMGISKSSLPVTKFFYDFTTLGKNVFRITDNITPGLIAGLTSDDLIIIFSVSGKTSSASMRDFIESATDLHCRIILITATANSELQDKATLSLQLPMIRLDNGTIADNHALMIFLVDIIVAYYIHNT